MYSIKAVVEYSVKTLNSGPRIKRWRPPAQGLEARKVLPIHFEGWMPFTEGCEGAGRAFAAPELAGRTHRLRSGETAVID